MRAPALLRASGRALLLPHPWTRAPAPSPASFPRSAALPWPSCLDPPRPCASTDCPSPLSSSRIFRHSPGPHPLVYHSHTALGPRFAQASAAPCSVAPMSSQAGSDAEVIGLRRGTAAIAVLNRPKALNSLNDNMVDLLRGYLEQWEKDPSVNLVIVKSDGRAFCAGGDVRKCHDLGRQGKWEEAAQFFRKEYELNYIMATYKKPCVPLINGVVMGGGNGISMHCPFRVVTEKVLFAMPETLIGLHPDVGASYFLPRLPGYFGEFLALTGVRLKAADMLACGLATHIVPSDRLQLLEDRLCALRVPEFESVEMAIAEHAEAAHPLELQIMPRLAVIDRCFQHPTVEEIIAALEAGAAAVSQPPEAGEGAEGAGDADADADVDPADPAEVAKFEAELDAQFCAQLLETLKKMSPTSLKVSLRSVREGRHQSLEECLVKETRLSYRCMEQTTSPDYYEGVRALLVDKDNNPKFFPATLAEVTPEMLGKHFQPLADPRDEINLDAIGRGRRH